MTEVKESVAEMTVEERLEVAALIAHLNRADDPEYQEELDRLREHGRVVKIRA